MFGACNYVDLPFSICFIAFVNNSLATANPLGNTAAHPWDLTKACHISPGPVVDPQERTLDLASSSELRRFFAEAKIHWSLGSNWSFGGYFFSIRCEFKRKHGHLLVGRLDFPVSLVSPSSPNKNGSTIFLTWGKDQSPSLLLEELWCFFSGKKSPRRGGWENEFSNCLKSIWRVYFGDPKNPTQFG